jgi:hypothetical protein
MSMEQRESREAQEDGRRVDPEIRNVRLMAAGSGAEELVCVVSRTNSTMSDHVRGPRVNGA